MYLRKEYKEVEEKTRKIQKERKREIYTRNVCKKVEAAAYKD